MASLKKGAHGARIGDLTPAQIDVVLTGDSSIDPFLMFEMTAAQVEAAWEKYGPALRMEAERRGLHVSTATGRPCR